MPTLVSDDGTTAQVLGEDGFTYNVPSEEARRYGFGALLPEPAPPPPPEPEMNFPPDDLSQPQAPGLPQGAPVIPPAAVIQQAPPVAPAPAVAPQAEPQPAPVAAPPPVEPEVTLPLDPADEFTTSSILPDQPLNTPTQLAGAINETAQVKADSALRTGQAAVAAAEDINQASIAAEAKVAEEERKRAEELKQRQADEAVLGEKHTKMVDRYANFKVDPNRGMSTERQTLAWIGAAIAGIGQVLNGGDGTNNPVIPMIFAQMDKRVQLQMAERDALGNSIGMSKEGIADFRNATKTRMGEYDLRMAAALERAAKETDRVKVRLGSIQEREAATQLAQTFRAEAATRMGTAKAQEAAALAKARAARAAAVAAQRKAEEEGRRFRAKEKVVYDPATNSYVPDPRFADPNAALDTQGKILANEKARRDLSSPTATEGTVARVKDEAARSVNGFDGKPLMRVVVQKDAQGNDVKVAVPVKAKTEKEGQDLRNVQGATATLARASQLLRTAIKNTGGSTEIVGSAEYQEAQSLLNQIDLTNKDIQGLGVIQGADMKILAGVRGGVDPTSFIKDASPGLEAMEKRAVEKYNAKLKAVTDYADTVEGGGVQEPAKAAPAKAAEEASPDLVRAFTSPRPDLDGTDKAAEADDAEWRLAAAKTFLKREKPTPEAIGEFMRAVSAANMPAATKAQVLATLQDAKAKAENDPRKIEKQLSEYGPAGAPLFGGAAATRAGYGLKGGK